MTLERLHAAIMRRREDDIFTPDWLVTTDGISDFMIATDFRFKVAI